MVHDGLECPASRIFVRVHSRNRIVLLIITSLADELQQIFIFLFVHAQVLFILDHIRYESPCSSVLVYISVYLFKYINTCLRFRILFFVCLRLFVK